MPAAGAGEVFSKIFLGRGILFLLPGVFIVTPYFYEFT